MPIERTAEFLRRVAEAFSYTGPIPQRAGQVVEPTRTVSWGSAGERVYDANGNLIAEIEYAPDSRPPAAECDEVLSPTAWEDTVREVEKAEARWLEILARETEICGSPLEAARRVFSPDPPS